MVVCQVASFNLEPYGCANGDLASSVLQLKAFWEGKRTRITTDRRWENTGNAAVGAAVSAAAGTPLWGHSEKLVFTTI